MDLKFVPFDQEPLENKFKLLLSSLNASNSGVIITDNTLPDNPIIFCNDAFETISGYKKEEVIGHNCRFLQATDRKQEARFKIKEAIENGEPITIEIVNYKKDGTLFHNELSISPVKDDSGNTTHFIGIQNDITRRKLAEISLEKEKEAFEQKLKERTQQIKDNEEYLESIFQTVRESLIVLNPDIEVLTVNDCFYKTFQVSKEDTIGKKLYELGNGQWNIPALKELIEEVLPHNNPFEDFAVEHIFPKIGRRIMLLNARQIELEGIYKEWILLAIEDVTDRVELERRKDDFLRIASHELKTPLTTVKGYIHLIDRLLPADSGEKLKEIVHKTIVYTDRLHNLIADLLDISKIQAGKLELDKADFDFDKMVFHAMESIQSTTKTHLISLSGSTNTVYYGDENRLEQVVVNLLTNAVKYSPKSKQVALQLSVNGDSLELSVTDYGLGIKRDDQQRIFERFFRVDSIQKRYPGMGIGLYVCDQIIKEHKGTLWVDSELGQGATFRFTLPLNSKVEHAKTDINL